jgi:hypothetical protein
MVVVLFRPLILSVWIGFFRVVGGGRYSFARVIVAIAVKAIVQVKDIAGSIFVTV